MPGVGVLDRSGSRLCGSSTTGNNRYFGTASCQPDGKWNFGRRRVATLCMRVVVVGGWVGVGGGGGCGGRAVL